MGTELFTPDTIDISRKDSLNGLFPQDLMCFLLCPSTKGIKPGNVSFAGRCK